MRLSDEVSKRIALLGFICAVLVVFIHVQRPVDCDYLVIRWISLRLSKIAVPFFFVASGFFLVSHAEEQGWWRTAVVKRVKTLVVPFFLLNVVWFPIYYGMHWIGVTYFNAHHDGAMDITVLNFLKGISIVPGFGMPVLFPLWYVRVLFFLVLITPALVWLVKQSRVFACAFAGILFLLGCVQMQVMRGGELSVFHLFYFTLGMILRFHVRYERRHGFYGAMCLFGGAFFWNVLPPLAIFLTLFGVWQLLPTISLPHWCNQASFQIYVLHVMVLYVVGAVCKAQSTLWEMLNTEFGILLTVVFTVLACCGINLLLKKYSPRVSLLFFGGR